MRLVNGLIERLAALRADPLPQQSRGLSSKFDRWEEFLNYRDEYRKYRTAALWQTDPSDVLMMSLEDDDEEEKLAATVDDTQANLPASRRPSLHAFS